MSQRPALVDGCFDPFHPGHVKYLEKARHLAGERVLVCKIASDAQVAQKHVPLLSSPDRAALVRPFVDDVLIGDDTVPAVISSLNPDLYIKGSDWRGKLPADHLDACMAVGCDIVYTHSVHASSTRLLSEWQQKSDQRFLKQFEQIAAEQVQPVFDETYWKRQGFTYEQRVEIEGDHPDVLLKTFPDMSILDYGCGEGHFLGMLAERGAQVQGWDPYVKKHAVHPQPADVVVCREMFEHVPLREWGRISFEISHIAHSFVYVTARFNDHPQHLLDVQTSDDLDYTHISRVNQTWLRSLFVAHGMRRREDLESAMDHQKKGRCLVYEHGH